MKMQFHKLGWAVAAACIAVMAAGGFQDTATKMGVVDITKLIESSDFGRESRSTFDQMKAAREGVLEFVDTYRVLSAEQAAKFRDLSLKTTPTAAEKAQLDTLKAEIIAADKKNKELSTKPNLTPEERTLMQEYANRSAASEATANRWLREFTSDLEGFAQKQRQASLERAKAAAQEVGKAQSYTIVLDAAIAPYAANDVTDAALKAMNARK